MAASPLSHLHIGLLFLALWIPAVFCIKGLGTACSSNSNCPGSLVCTSGQCSEPADWQTCSWAGHGIGTSCTTDDECSDELICSESSICIDPYGITPTALTWTPPNFLSFSCYNRTWWVPPPTDCEGHACHGESLWAIMLEVHGVNFNVGNVQMIISKEGNATSYFDGVVSAVAGLPGLPSGAFDLKTTTVPCSLGGDFVVDVLDECTGTWIHKNVA